MLGLAGEVGVVVDLAATSKTSDANGARRVALSVSRKHSSALGVMKRNRLIPQVKRNRTTGQCATPSDEGLQSPG